MPQEGHELEDVARTLEIQRQRSQPINPLWHIKFFLVGGAIVAPIIGFGFFDDDKVLRAISMLASAAIGLLIDARLFRRARENGKVS